MNPEIDVPAFLNSLIGLPWKPGAKGPEEFDCWGLSQLLQKELFGRTLPDVTVDAEDIRLVIKEISQSEHRRFWKRVPHPENGCLVEMSSGKHPYHIGTYINLDGGGIFHCQNPSGVCFDRIPLLKIAGWRNFKFNDWKD